MRSATSRSIPNREWTMAATNYIWDPLSDNVVMEVDDGGDVLAEYTQEPTLYGEVVSQHRSGAESHVPLRWPGLCQATHRQRWTWSPTR